MIQKKCLDEMLSKNEFNYSKSCYILIAPSCV